jgi:hypothetical protein
VFSVALSVAQLSLRAQVLPGSLSMEPGLSSRRHRCSLGASLATVRSVTRLKEYNDIRPTSQMAKSKTDRNLEAQRDVLEVSDDALVTACTTVAPIIGSR